jgi:hypothetical protein
MIKLRLPPLGAVEISLPPTRIHDRDLPHNPMKPSAFSPQYQSSLSYRPWLRSAVTGPRFRGAGWIMPLAAAMAAGSLWSAPARAAEAGETQVPVFAGALLDEDATRQKGEETTESSDSESIIPGSRPLGAQLKVYATPTPIEEVFRFYLQRYGAKPQEGNGVNPATLSPGASTPVQFQLNTYDFDSEKDKTRRLLAANRKPGEDGNWIRDVNFIWFGRDRADVVTGFSVEIEDRSVSEDTRQYAAKTLIAIQTHAFDVSAGARRRNATERHERSEVDLERRMGEMAEPPSADLVGAPPYPGAFYDVRNSAGMSLSDTTVYLFLTTDLPAKVAGFYAAKLGKPVPAPDADGRYIFVLKPGMPLPAKSIMVEPNRVLDPKYKTVISFGLNETNR